jgi:uncharacterized protein YbjT (DUF2867 family)
MENKSALIAGATGLVGGHCLHFLRNRPEISEIRVVTRRPLGLSDPRIKEHIIDFDRLDQHHEIIRADYVFCCLGATMKKAGDQEAFRRVDYQYPRLLADISSNNGSENFLLISAMGANPKSKIFYNRVKGELEEAVSAMPFTGIFIFRPSLFMGKRKEFRAGEKAGDLFFRLVNPLLVGRLRKYRTIEAQAVAKAMVYMAPTRLKGLHIFESNQIQFFYDRLQNPRTME